jgi:hypothetical protein
LVVNTGKMRISSRIYLITALFLFTGLAGFIFRKQVPDAYARYLSYNELYSVRDALHIKDIRRLPQDSIRVELAGGAIRPVNHFEVLLDGAKMLDIVSPMLTMKPAPGKNDYEIRINSSDSCRINVDMPDIRSSLLLLQGRLDMPEEWRSYDTLTAGEPDMQEVRSYLADSMKINPGESPEEKVKKIARYILSITHDRFGTPADSFYLLTPMRQLQCVQRGSSRLLCGGYSGIYAFFCNKAGIPCRTVGAGRDINGMYYAPHVVNEVWLKEYGCWAYADLTDGIVMARKNGRLLNVLDIQRLLYYDAADTTIAAVCYQGDSLINAPFGKVSVSSREAFDHNTQFHFYYGRYDRLSRPAGIGEKIVSLLYAGDWYVLYSDNESPVNYAFYLRIISGYLFLLMALIWLMALIRQIYGRVRQ